jgi:nucleoside-diphosphate-sugar epimerase
MRILVFGATGRVGSEIVKQAIGKGHDVTVFARSPKRLLEEIKPVAVVCGDVRDGAAVMSAIGSRPYDAVLSAIGFSKLEPSTLVTDGTRSILNSMHSAGLCRYLAVSGTAEMPNPPIFGRITNAIFRCTPVGHPIRDHDGAYALVKTSWLDWTLAGCPYIRDGPAKGAYKTELTCPGGFQIIHPPDVADFMVRELVEHRFSRQIVGLWY